MTTVFSDQYCHFFDDAAFEETNRPGFRRRVITGDHLQLCFWRISGGASGSYLHQHEAHEQLGIVMRGALDFRIGDPDDAKRTVLRAGEVYLAPAKVWHGDSLFVGDDELEGGASAREAIARQRERCYRPPEGLVELGVTFAIDVERRKGIPCQGLTNSADACARRPFAELGPRLG